MAFLILLCLMAIILLTSCGGQTATGENNGSKSTTNPTGNESGTSTTGNGTATDYNAGGTGAIGDMARDAKDAVRDAADAVGDVFDDTARPSAGNTTAK